MVKEVHVLEGEMVKQGQVLVNLVEDDARLALSAAKAALAESEAALTAAKLDLEPLAIVTGHARAFAARNHRP